MAERAPRTALAAALVAATLTARADAQQPPAPPRAVEPAPPSITFVEAVRQSLARNPSAAIADEEIRRAHALMEQARAASLPTLAATGTYTRLDSDRVLPGNPPRVIVPADSVNANLTLTVPLVQPRGWAAWSHAKENVDVARASKADVQRQVALATGRAYLTVVAQKRLLETATRARDTAKAHYDYAHERFVGGVGNKIDEVRAAQELASDESQLQSSAVALVRARESLGVLVGIEGPLDAVEEGLPASTPTLATALDEAKTRRADVVAAERRVRAAEHVRRDDWTDLSPYLTAIAQPFYQNPPSLTQPLTGWQAQLVLTLPLYDGGVRYGQWHERDALAAEAKTSLEGALRQARSDVRAAFEALRRADDALQSARDAARLAGEALDLANLAYRAGATTNIEVIDAERRARDAETQAAIAEDNARNARLDLLAASGRFP